MFSIWLVILFCAANAFSQVISLEGGINYFLGNLQDEIKIPPYGAIGFELELSDYTTGYSQGSYSYLKLKRNLDFHGLHQFVGRAGIETSEQICKHAAIGLGISLAGVRGSAASPAAEEYMLNTSESDFGWNIRLKFNVLRIEKFTIGARFYYDKIWTEPQNSNLLQGGIFASYYI